MSETQTKKLSDFLKEHNCYDSFVEQFDIHFWWIYDEFYVQLHSGFNWKDSYESEDYWGMLNKLWEDIPSREYDMNFLIKGEIK